MLQFSLHFALSLSLCTEFPSLLAFQCLDVPIFAARFILSTLTHSATEAPLLSMTLHNVLSCIMSATFRPSQGNNPRCAAVQRE